MEQPMFTPPRSPAFDSMDVFFVDQPADIRTVRSTVREFTCSKTYSALERNSNINSYLRNGDLASMLYGAPHGDLPLSTSLQLFGLDFNADSAFILEYKLLTNFVLQQSKELDCYARDVPLFQRRCSDVTTRKTEVCSVLTYFREYVSHHVRINAHGDLDADDSFCEAFTHIVKELSNYAYSVSELPSHVVGNRAVSGSPAYALFHVHWDVRFTILAMLKTICRVCSRNNYGKLGSFCSTVLDKIILRMIEDLLYLASRSFERLSPTEWPEWKPFPCACVEELWVIIYHVTQSGLVPFWNCLNQILDTLTPPRSSKVETMDTYEELRKPQFHGKDSLFTVWINTHLADLGNIDEYGVHTVKKVEGNYDYLAVPVRMILQSRGLKEITLRGLLGCMLSLTRTWGPNFRTCVEFWEYFSRRLNDSFIHPDAPFETTIVLCKSGISWCELLSAGRDSAADISRTSSFFLFLRLLGYHAESAEWKSLKGRIYLKLFKVADLNLMGSYHVISVWLCLALRADANDAWTRFEESFKDAWTPLTPANKKIAFLSAHVAFLLTFIKRQLPCADVAAALGRCVALVAREFKDNQHKMQSQAAELGQVFVEGFQELVLSSGKLTLGQFDLIDGQLALFLRSCGTSERNQLLECFANLVERLRKNPFEGDEIYERLSNHIVKNNVEWLLESSEGCTLIAQTSLYLLENLRANARGFLTQVVENANIKSTSVCRVLSTLLGDAKFLPALAANVQEHSQFLISAWFRIAVTVESSESSEDVAKLESAVKELPDVVRLFNRTGLSGSGDSNDFYESFLKALSSVHSSSQTLVERSSWKQVAVQYFGPVEKYLSGCCRTWQPPAEVIRVYRRLAVMFVQCSSIMYTKGKSDNLLSRIVSLLILPRAFFDVTKPLPTAVQSAIQQTLHLYARGLCALNPAGDPYISRCVREIFMVYLPRFPINAMHPITRCSIDPEARSLVRAQFLAVYREQVINRRGDKINQPVITALQWLRHIVTYPDWRLDVMDKLLAPVLVFLLNLDEHSPARRVTLELVQLLISSEGTNRPEISEMVSRAVAELVRSNLAFNTVRLFKLLDALALFNLGVVKESFPLIVEVVRETEIKRGTGTDLTLRRHVDKLGASLGLAGQL